MGSTGPSSLKPKTKPDTVWQFPVITISDMVRLQEKLITYLGIKKIIRSNWWINGWYASFRVGCKI